MSFRFKQRITLMSFRIGDIEIQGYVVLGPMAGYTTLAYRKFMKKFGVGLSYSEMISDCGISYGNRKTYEYLATDESERPVGLQLFGFDIENSKKAIQIMDEIGKFDILDLNFGCPVHKVVKTGAGSAWMRDPVKMEEYVREIVKVSKHPVTAKIRLGWDDKSINVFEVVHRLEDAGVSAITIHCRTREQGYTGKADYHALDGLKETMRVPLIVSGDIFTPEDAKRAMEITHADGVMVARGGVGNPYLVTQINHYLETGELLPSPSVLQQADYAEEFSNMLIEQFGEDVAIRQLRGILPHFFSGFAGHKKLRVAIATTLNSKADIDKILAGIRKKETQ